jgi:hypothetical protein
VSWARDAVAAIRKIVLIEDRVESLTARVKSLAEAYTDIDRRLVRLEAKFEFMERLAGGGSPRRALPEKTESSERELLPSRK